MNVNILNDTLKCFNGDTFVALYQGGVLKSVYNTTQAAFQLEKPYTVKVFNFSDVIPLKNVAEYYFK